MPASLHWPMIRSRPPGDCASWVSAQCSWPNQQGITVAHQYRFLSSRYPCNYARSLWNHGVGQAQAQSAPYPFIIEALASLEPEVRPMFSGFAVYVGEKIVLMLRDSPKHPEDNGVWLVFSETAILADPRIRRDFPSLRLINLLGGKIAHWRLIPA